MSILTPTQAAAPVRTRRDARRARRLTAAILLPVAPLSVAVLRLIWPAFSADDTAASLDAVAAHRTAQQAVVWLGLLMTLTMIPAVLAAARLARRRRPVLAMVAAGVNLVAYLGGTVLVASDLLTLVAARSGYDRATIVPYLDAVNGHASVSLGMGLFVLGHIVGMILLGAALWRIIPTWASIALIISQPLHLVSFVVLQIQPLDAFAWGLTALGFAACAVAVARTPDDEWDLAPASA
jgi:hypothetical protein